MLTVSLIKCRRCHKMYDDDERFYDGDVRCPFCHAKPSRISDNESIMEKQYQQEKAARKYNDYKYTCPMCSSHNIKNISLINKAFSFGLFSFASDKIGKCYQCDDCNYKW